MTETMTPRRFKGWRGHYMDIAVRGQEILSLAVDYAPHPSNVGCFILRFVARDTDATKFKHLTFREEARFSFENEKGHTERFKAIRLNKLAIQAFSPAVPQYEAREYAQTMGIWALMGEWVAEQVAAEGFTLINPDIAATLKEIAYPAGPSDVQNVLTFPKLDSPEEQVAALKLVKKPEPEPEEDDDEDDGDDDADWLN